MLQKTNLPLVDVFLSTPGSPSGRFCARKQLPFINKDPHEVFLKADACEIMPQRKKLGLASFLQNNIRLHRTLTARGLQITALSREVWPHHHQSH